MDDTRTSQASELMMRFADRTGLTSDGPGRRYLWTDAFAVCNFLGLERATGDKRHQDLAVRLVDRVHHDLGRYRSDDRRRSGWISGLPDGEAERHPTRGGLRIGKFLPERGMADPFVPDLEWDRDGQYFHYLTKWMRALDQVARWTAQTEFTLWARELAHTAHRAFTHGPPGAKRMMWKLSIDLSRPLVASMGHHDPLDGFVTCRQLDATAAARELAAEPSLAAAVTDFADMLDPAGLATTDPLGIGGLLVDACLLAQLEMDRDLVTALLHAAAVGLRSFLAEADLRAPAHRRLAFRELGLAIGLAGASMMLEMEGLRRSLEASAQTSLAKLAELLPLRTEIESFWLDPPHRRTSTWVEHADINDVMLATSLAPGGLLELGCLRARGSR
jgi:hypothetical protein